MGGSLFEVSPSQALYLTLEGHYRYNTGSSVANGTQVRTVALTGLNGDHLGHFVGANGSQVNADLGVNSTIDIDSFEIGFIGGVGSDECNL